MPQKGTTLPSLTDSVSTATFGFGGTLALSDRVPEEEPELRASRTKSKLGQSMGAAKVESVGRVLVMLRKLISAESASEVNLLGVGVRAECEALQMPEVAAECNLFVHECGKLRSGTRDRWDRRLASTVNRFSNIAGLAEAKAKELTWDRGVCERQTQRRALERDNVVNRYTALKNEITTRNDAFKQPLEELLVENDEKLTKLTAMHERSENERKETKRALVERGRKAREVKVQRDELEQEKIARREFLTAQIADELKPTLKQRKQDLVDELEAGEIARDRARAAKDTARFRDEDYRGQMRRVAEQEIVLAEEHRKFVLDYERTYAETQERLTAQLETAKEKNAAVRAELDEAEALRDKALARLEDAEERLRMSADIIERINATEAAEKEEERVLGETFSKIEQEKQKLIDVEKRIAELQRWAKVYEPRARTSHDAVKTAEGLVEERFEPVKRVQSSFREDASQMPPKKLAQRLHEEAEALVQKIKKDEEDRMVAKDRAVALETELANLKGLYRIAVDKVVKEDTEEFFDLEKKHEDELAQAARRLYAMEQKASADIGRLEVSALTQERYAAQTIKHRAEDAENTTQEIRVDLAAEVARLTKHCEEVLEGFDKELREKTKQVGLRVTAAKDQAIASYTAMKNDEAKVANLEKQFVDLTEKLQDTKECVLNADAEARESQAAAAKLTQEVIDRESFWEDQHAQIKATVGTAAQEIRVRMTAEVDELTRQLYDYPERIQFLSDMLLSVEETVAEARGATEALRRQVDELLELRDKLTDQVQKATPRGKLSCAIGGAELHIWRLQQTEVVRQHGEEVEAVLAKIDQAAEPLAALRDESDQLREIEALLADGPLPHGL